MVPNGRASPGPARPQYWIPWNATSQDMEVRDNGNIYPLNHPERVDLSLLQRDPFMRHPAINGESELSRIPFWRQWDNAVMYDEYRECQVESHAAKVCGRPTRSGCEDYSHYGDGMPICDECERESRNKFLGSFQDIVMTMRQYLCVSDTQSYSPFSLPWGSLSPVYS
ncbi:hypothetical protein F5Y06DRAFT_8013 [Hypoxylon sp. FL0890]|nr:hypothetical protein F5Y06DRAFT_8013 [Hypoxylon sp. FL0890]